MGWPSLGTQEPLEAQVSLRLGQQACIPSSCHLGKPLSPYGGDHMVRWLSEPWFWNQLAGGPSPNPQLS